MKRYDVKCPHCGTMNQNLYLEETNGWMECDHCKRAVKVLQFAVEKKVPLYTPKQLADVFAVAT